MLVEIYTEQDTSILAVLENGDVYRSDPGVNKDEYISFLRKNIYDRLKVDIEITKRIVLDRKKMRMYSAFIYAYKKVGKIIYYTDKDGNPKEGVIRGVSMGRNRNTAYYRVRTPEGKKIFKSVRSKGYKFSRKLAPGVKEVVFPASQFWRENRNKNK